MSLRFSGLAYTLYGEILNVRSCLDGTEPTWFAEVREPDFFSEIILSNSMFVDHMPWHLEAGLHALSERLNSQ